MTDVVLAGLRDHPVIGKALAWLAVLWAAKSTDVLGMVWRGIEAVVLESVELSDAESAIPIVWFLASRARRTHLDGRSLDAAYAPIISLGERRLVFSTRATRSNVLLWYRGRPIQISPFVKLRVAIPADRGLPLFVKTDQSSATVAESSENQYNREVT